MDGGVVAGRSDLIDGHSLGSVEARLRAVDWTFSERERALALESIHPYPAKFIGEIPRAFLSTLPIPSGTGVLDPFCGSGTTLIESQRAGLPSVGIDLNPIACLISRVKTSPLSSGLLEAAGEVVKIASAQRSLVIPDIPNLDHWFKPDVQAAVAAIAESISLGIFEKWQDALRLALSSILVRVSNQDSDTRYAAVEKTVSSRSVFEAFSAASARLERALTERKGPLTSAKVIQGDTLKVLANQIDFPIGLVVTSPPYPNAYEYWLYHKYRMWWLGFDPIAVREQEIGARPHFFKKNPHTADVFVNQMGGTFSLISKVLVPLGYVCFVVGRSRIHGELVDNGSIIEDVAAKFGLEKVVRLERTINSKRKSFNLSHANIKTESVLVFRKGLV